MRLSICWRRAGVSLSLVGSILIHLSCAKTDPIAFMEMRKKVENNPQSDAHSPSDPAHTYCDPLGQGGSSSSTEGLSARLWFLPSGSTQYSHVNDYQVHGQSANATLYFNDLFVPTRPFTAGFENAMGNLLQDDHGNPLIEWFSLHFESQLVLGPHDPEGYYQLGILSDDGSIVSVDTGAGLNTLIDDDGLHPTRMGCASNLIHLTHSSRVPLDIAYFQGPMYHIALVLMWRLVQADHGAQLAPVSALSPVSAQQVSVYQRTDLAVLDVPVVSPPNEPLCGQSGNSLFFDSTYSVGSNYRAQQAYIDLLSRGWEPIQQENYLLYNENPCAGGATY